MPSIDLFAEDHAHQLFVTALIKRIAGQVGLDPSVNVRSAVGGHGRAIAALKVYQQAVAKRVAGLSPPDLLVVVIDANCSGVGEARAAIQRDVRTDAAGDTVIACPDPHIERWFFADPESFRSVVGADGQPGKRKCVRDEYKNKLRQAVLDAGHFPTLGGLEFAQDLIDAMDLYRASRNEPSLGGLIEAVGAFMTRATNQTESR